MSQARREQYAPEWQVWAALGVVYVVWGSTYLAIRVVVETMPPLLAAGARHVSAALILFVFLALRHGAASLRLTRNEWIGAGFVGLALLLGGNGLVMLGERDVPSSLAALIVAVVPLWVVLLRLIFRERVGGGTLFGVVAGFTGVALLIVPRGLGGSVEFGGTLMLVVAGASWSVGSYFSRRVELPRDPLASTGAQMMVGGVGLIAIGLVAGETGLLAFDRFSTASVVSLVYLVLFGSVLAYTAYTWLLQHASVSRVATYAYVNPVVAIVLGWWLLSEQIDLTMIVGAAVIVVAVGLVIRTESRATQPTGALETSPTVAAEAGDRKLAAGSDAD